MRSVGAVCLCVSAVILAAALEGGAQQRPADPNDPRVGLKAGLKDAGEAARNMKRISSLPKPEGFFDPANPAGAITMVHDLFATEGAGQTPEIFSYASDVDADQRMEIDRMDSMLRELQK